MSELPEGWAEATLADLGDWSSGGTPSRSKPEYFRGDVPFVKTGDLNDSWLSSIPEMISESGLQNSSAKLFPEGTLLIAMYGATIGKTARLSIPAATNQACAALLGNEANSEALDYVWAYLRSQLENLRAAGKGGAQPNISQTLLKSYPIPLPPLAEQQRIVRKLDTLSARTTTARTHLAAIAKLVERYKRGIYDYHFTNAGERVPLGNLAKVGTGATPKKGNPRYYDHGNVPWVTSGAVNDKTVNEPSGYITETALNETNCKLFPAGSLLMAMYGEGKTRGQVARLGIEAATNQALAVIHEIDVQKVNVDYLYLFLDSIYLEIRELAEGGVQPNLSLGKVKSFELPLPSFEEQCEVVRRIETAFTKIDRLTAEADKALKLIDRLGERILAKAFAGELVPQDPNDEPASVLLDRIREARANAPKKTRPRRTKATAMKKDPKDLLLADSAKWPANGVTSEELAKRVVMPHSDLRDALFDLLGGSKPQLEQVFDKTEERMRLKRVAQ